MVDLKKFNLNTTFPAVAKTTSVSGTCTLNSQTIGAQSYVSSSITLTVGSGDICETTLYVDGEYIPYTRFFASGVPDGIEYMFAIERINATQVNFYVGARNSLGSPAICNAKTATVYISAFNVP